MSKFGPEGEPPLGRTPDMGVYSQEQQGGRMMRVIHRPFADLALAYYPDGAMPTTTEEAERYLRQCAAEYQTLQNHGVDVLRPEYSVSDGVSGIIVATAVEALEGVESLSRLEREERVTVSARDAVGRRNIEGLGRYLEARIGDGQARTGDPFLYDVFGLKQWLAIGQNTGQARVVLADVEPRIVAPDSALRPRFMLEALAHFQDIVVLAGMFSAGKHVERRLDSPSNQHDFKQWRDMLATRILDAEGITDRSRLELFQEFVNPSLDNLTQLPEETFESMGDVLTSPR